jgi:hypothetical protein
LDVSALLEHLQAASLVSTLRAGPVTHDTAGGESSRLQIDFRGNQCLLLGAFLLRGLVFLVEGLELHDVTAFDLFVTLA